MFIEAAVALSDMVDPEMLKAGALYPPLAQLRAISARIAATTIECAIRNGQSAMAFSSSAEVLAFVHAEMWSPPRHDEEGLPLAVTFRRCADGEQAADCLDESDDCSLDAPQLCA
jgi:hypothetical protein